MTWGNALWDGTSLHAMLTGGTRAFSQTVQLLTPVGLPPGAGAGPPPGQVPQDGRCEGRVVQTQATSGGWKPLLRQKAQPLQCSGVPVDETTAGEETPSAGGWAGPAAPRAGPLDVVGERQGDVPQQ